MPTEIIWAEIIRMKPQSRVWRVGLSPEAIAGRTRAMADVAAAASAAAEDAAAAETAPVPETAAVESPRERSQMLPEQLAGIMRPYCKTWKGITYGEGKKAPVDERLITAQREFVKKLQEAQNNISYPLTLIKGGLKIIAVERQQVFT